MTDELERIRSEYTKRDAANASHVYTYTNPVFMYHMQERERGLLRMLDRVGVELPASDVLEVGCGTGHILQRFLEFGARSAVGVDLMANRIEMGKPRYAAVRMVCGDAGRLPFDSESFDLVIQFMCLSSVLEPALRAQIAAEMWRVLAPDGVILSYDMRRGSILQSSINVLANYLNGTGVKNGNVPVVTPTRPVGLNELKEWFPDGSMQSTLLSLNLNLAVMARVSWSVASILSSIPALRSHVLAVVRKPAEGNRARR